MAAALPFIVAGLSAYSAISQGMQANANAKNQAAAAEYNAAQGQANARTALQAANANEEQQRRTARQFLGQQRAALSESGLGLDGTGSGIYEQSALNSELDALNIRYEGQQQANAFKTGAALDMQSAKATRASGKNALTAGFINAGTAGLTGYNNYTNNKLLQKRAAS